MEKLVGAVLSDIERRLEREVLKLAAELPKSMGVEKVDSTNGESHGEIPALDDLWTLLSDLENMSQDLLRVYR